MSTNRKQIKLSINGMTCIQCENRIQRRLCGTTGVITASVSYRTATADIVYDGRKISQEDIIRVIESLDYTVQSQKSAKDFWKRAGILPEYGITHTFHEGENILEFTPTETGTYAYSCWMGMIRGSITVTDAGSDDIADVPSVVEESGNSAALPTCCS